MYQAVGGQNAARAGGGRFFAVNGGQVAARLFQDHLARRVVPRLEVAVVKGFDVAGGYVGQFQRRGAAAADVLELTTA